MTHSNSGALLSLDRLVAVAHRGGSKLRPENTLQAFDHAMTLGVDALECDVHLSRDGEVVVIHDFTLDRTTDATGPVAARTAAELRNVDAGYRFGEADGFPFRGQQICVPTLRELLDRYADVPTIIEMKGEDVGLARRTLALVREMKLEARVILAGFSQALLDEVRRLAPDIVTSASSAEARSAIGRSKFFLPVPSIPARVFQVPYRVKGQVVFGPRFVKRARAAGIPVQVWVVNEAEEMEQLIAMGVTGLISDRPDIAVRVCAQAKRAL
jgi:glycerophosphoryl diester phosphodiesterase